MQLLFLALNIQLSLLHCVIFVINRRIPLCVILLALNQCNDIETYDLLLLIGGVKYLLRGILFKLADGGIGPYEKNDESAGTRTTQTYHHLKNHQ